MPLYVEQIFRVHIVQTTKNPEMGSRVMNTMPIFADGLKNGLYTKILGKLSLTNQS